MNEKNEMRLVYQNNRPVASHRVGPLHTAQTGFQQNTTIDIEIILTWLRLVFTARLLTASKYIRSTYRYQGLGLSYGAACQLAAWFLACMHRFQASIAIFTVCANI